MARRYYFGNLSVVLTEDEALIYLEHGETEREYAMMLDEFRSFLAVMMEAIRG